MIGLLTFHNVTNYGAVMQAYALQRVLKDFGCESEYINLSFNPKNVPRVKQSNRIILLLKKFQHPLKKLYQRKKEAKFQNFRRENIRISQKGYHGDKEMSECNGYDKYIVGSDQVWNFDITNTTKAYLLDFVPDGIPKYSYASSIGVDSLTQEQKEIFKSCLSRFDAISVREEQAKKMIDDLVNQEISVVVDPTMLLKADEWKKIAVLPKQKEYILIYAMADSDGLIQQARKLSKDRKLPILAIGLKKKYPGIRNLYTVGPEEWLGYFCNASAVVTNSFHGTSFSLIFNKDLYLEYLPSGWSVNSRLENAVKLFGLSERLIGVANQPENHKISYEKINQILKEKRIFSLSYVEKICKST